MRTKRSVPLPTMMADNTIKRLSTKMRISNYNVLSYLIADEDVTSELDLLQVSLKRKYDVFTSLEICCTVTSYSIKSRLS